MCFTEKKAGPPAPSPYPAPAPDPASATAPLCDVLGFGRMVCHTLTMDHFRTARGVQCVVLE